MSELDLREVYRRRKWRQPKRDQLELLVHYIREKSTNQPDGWYFDKHVEGEQISRKESLFYMRAVLAIYLSNDAHFDRMVEKAFLTDGESITNELLTKDVFAPTKDKEGNIVQLMIPAALQWANTALEDPSKLHQLLEEARKTHKPGWIVVHSFKWEIMKRQPVKKLTTLEARLFRLQAFVLCAYDVTLDGNQGDDFLGLMHAWGTKYNIHKLGRDMTDWTEKHHKKTELIIRRQKKVQRSHSTSLAPTPSKGGNPSRRPPAAYDNMFRSGRITVNDLTPAVTRSSQEITVVETPPLIASTSPVSPRTPLDHSPRARRWSHLTTASKMVNSVRRMMKRSRPAGTTPGHDTTNSHGSPMRSPVGTPDIRRADRSSPAVHSSAGAPAIPRTGISNFSPHLAEDDGTSNFSPYFAEDDDDDPQLPYAGGHRLNFDDDSSDDHGETLRPRTRNADSQQSTITLDTLENRFDKIVDQACHSEEAMVEALKERDDALEREVRDKDANAVLNSVLDLAAIGSPTMAAGAKAILINSMANRRASRYLVESGYPSKKKERVVQRKKAENEIRRKRAAKLGKEPMLVPEVATRQHKNPLCDKKANAKSQRIYDNYLAKGKDVPPIIRPTNVKEEKVDHLVKWIVEGFQFRPGKTRNCRFTREHTYLKNLPVYMRYGSYGTLFQNYQAATPPHLRVGLKTFRTILKATTVKGSYNQGLSYYYVEFVDMTKLLLKMLERVKSIVNDKGNVDGMTTEEIAVWLTKKKKVEEWIQKAKDNTERSRDYLTHHYYADIQKECNDGWTSATFALGDDSAAGSTPQFDQDSMLCLCLCNHLFILYLVELVMEFLPGKMLEDLSDELLSMIDLANLSAKEMFHYAKHLMRGWWQDTAINELRKLLLEFKSFKGCVMDHKNKLLPRSKFEAMSAYFSKAGISILGAMIFWAGFRTNKEGKKIEGVMAWFVDIVMNNTTSQEARDLMPCIEKIRSELQDEAFVSVCGPTDGFFILSDNALVNATHSAFITALNAQAKRTEDSCEQAREKESDEDSAESSVSQMQDASEANSESSDGRGCGQSQSLQVSRSQLLEDFDSDSSQDTGDPHSSAEKIDRFVGSMRQTFSDCIANWDCVEPCIVKWLTWEAQRGKTQLDTHFAYLNKHLTAACLEGGIDYLDPAKVFAALTYRGGARATTTILLDELASSQTLFDSFKKEMNDKKKGISSVHDITFNHDQSATHRNFSSLDTGEKIIMLDEVSAYSPENPLGHEVKRHMNKGEPIFFPFKQSAASGDSGTEDTDNELDPKLLSTRIYKSLIRYSSGMEVTNQELAVVAAERDAERQARQKKEVDQAVSDIRFILTESRDLIDSLDDAVQHPCKLKHGWAQTKRRSHFTISPEVVERLHAMFKEGQGVSSKATRYTAERAVMELHNGMLLAKWDQRLVCSVPKIKQFFGTKHQLDQKSADEKRKIMEETQETKIERAKALLAECKQCEDSIKELAESGDLEGSRLEDFAKQKPASLKAFIRCRLMEDAASHEYSKMPKKGTLADARNGKLCEKTGKPQLIQWAFELRSEAVKAVVNAKVSSSEQDSLLFDLGCQNKEPQQHVDFLEEVAGELLVDKEGDIEEVADDDDDDDAVNLEEEDDDDASVAASEGGSSVDS